MNKQTLLSKVHISLKPINILDDLQEGTNGEVITKSQHIRHLKHIYKSGFVYVMMKMDIKNKFLELTKWRENGLM